MGFYEVDVTATTTMIIEADTEEQARDAGAEQFTTSDVDWDVFATELEERPVGRWAWLDPTNTWGFVPPAKAIVEIDPNQIQMAL